MAERLGEAVLELRTDEARYTKGLKQAETGAQRLQRRLDAAGRVASRFARNLSIGLGVAGGALLALSKRAIDGAGSIADVADKVGLTTQALQELRFAAQQSGVQQNVLDLAMQRFSRRVGEAAQGTGVLKDALADYNIAVRDADGRQRALEDVLRDYANAVAGAESEQERLRLAFQAFDSEGAALVNLLREGGDEMDRLRARAQALGIVLDESTIRRAKQAGVELAEMNEVLRVGGMNIALEFLPVMRELARIVTDPATVQGARDLALAMRDLVQWSTENSETLLRIIGGLLGLTLAAKLGARLGGKGLIATLILGAGAGAFTPEILRMLGSDIEGLGDALDDLSGTAAAAGGSRGGVGLATDEFKKMQSAIEDLRFEARLLELDISDSVREAARAARAAGLVKNFDELAGSTDDATQAMADFARESERLKDLQDAAAVIERTKTAQERLNDELARLGELRPHLSAEQYARAVDEARSRLIEANEAMQDFSRVIATGFEDAVVEAKSFSEVLAALEKDLIRIAFRVAVTKPLEKALTGLLSSAIDGLAAPAAAPQLTGLGTPNPLLANPGVPAFAGGGMVGRPRLVMAHEGEGIFTPRQMDNANALLAALSGRQAGVTVNVHNNAGAEVRVRERRGQDGAVSLDVMVDRAVADALGRRGSESGRVLENVFGARRRLGRS